MIQAIRTVEYLKKNLFRCVDLLIFYFKEYMEVLGSIRIKRSGRLFRIKWRLNFKGTVMIKIFPTDF